MNVAARSGDLRWLDLPEQPALGSLAIAVPSIFSVVTISTTVARSLEMCLFLFSDRPIECYILLDVSLSYSTLFRKTRMIKSGHG